MNVLHWMKQLGALTRAEHWLFEHMAAALTERLAFIQKPLGPILLLNDGSYHLAHLVKQLYPNNPLVEFNPELRLLEKARLAQGLFTQSALICADILGLPFPAQQFGLIVINNVYPWQNEAMPILSQLRNLLKAGAPLIFSSFGPSTLEELHRKPGSGLLDDKTFLDMHLWGDMLLAAGFAHPVMDRQAQKVAYADKAQLEYDLAYFGLLAALVDTELKFPPPGLINYEFIFGLGFAPKDTKKDLGPTTRQEILEASIQRLNY